MTEQVRAIDLEPGMAIKVYDFDELEGPRRTVVEKVTTTQIIVTVRQVDENCPSGGCEGCGGGELDYLYTDPAQTFEVARPSTSPIE